MSGKDRIQIDATKTFWEHKSLFGFDWLRGHYFLPLLTHWAKKACGVIVDVGCGSKPYFQLFCKSASLYIGVDLPGKNSAADVYANALNLPIRSASVDLCFNVWLLDDLSDPARYFREVSRILKDDGRAIMIENQSFPEHDAPHDYFRFTRHGLAYLASEAGLIVEEMIPLGGFWAQIGLQLLAFFMRGVSGYLGGWVRLFNPLLNMCFYILDRTCYLPRGTSGWFLVLRKPNMGKQEGNT
jgi:SAM-dependent methyltransferase